MAADPDELHDLAADPAHADRLRAMTGNLHAWLRGRKDPVAPAD